MNGLIKFLEGKKTYLTCALIVIFGAIDAWNGYAASAGHPAWAVAINVPDWVFALLGSLGIYFRSQAGKYGGGNGTQILVVALLIGATLSFAGCAALTQAKADYAAGKSDTTIVASAEKMAATAAEVTKQTMSIIPVISAYSTVGGSVASAVVAVICIWWGGRNKRKDAEAITQTQPIKT